jgi:hypothetical protein
MVCRTQSAKKMMFSVSHPEQFRDVGKQSGYRLLYILGFWDEKERVFEK